MEVNGEEWDKLPGSVERSYFCLPEIPLFDKLYERSYEFDFGDAFL